MIYNGKEVEFPAIMKISFYKVIETLETMVKDKDKDVAAYGKELLKVVDKHPELRDGIDTMDEVRALARPIRKISRVMFPDALTTNEIKALCPPFYFEPIVTSARFDNIVKASGEDFNLNMKDVDPDTFYLYCCYFILGSYYGFPVPSGSSWTQEILNKDQGLLRTYKILINADMSEFIPTDKAVDITRADFEELIDNFGDIELWKKKFPPNSWIMRGVNVMNLVDVTIDQSVGDITSNLLLKSDDSFENIQNGIRSLLNNAKLEIGVLTFEDNQLIPIAKDQVRSILLKTEETMCCSTGMCEYSSAQLLQHKEPLVISDVERYHQRSNSAMSAKLMATRLKSYIVVPLLHEEQVLGFIEIGSPNRYDLNTGTIYKLDEIVPIIAMAQKGFIDEAQNRIEAIIQQECTTIHESVKWRFEQEAEKFMHKQMNNEQPVFKDIIFNNLYPLYGQVDIKGSSVKRNKAVSHDLVKQINGVEKVLKAAYRKTEMPAYEELIFRLENYKADIKQELSAGSEHKILRFLKLDIYPVFDHLKETDAEIKKLIDEYNEILDPTLNTVYEERKKYDTSVNQINQRLASYLDNRQEEAQRMFPHYFERYKTDGVEYNMYIGESITKDRKFDTIYLRNLRIWQLLVMCELENEFHKMQDELDTPIEVASLILVYNTSLSVHFRMDEKRFDVEGAYNARYEIIKKRVDKANIRGTKERITQPGKITIVYSQEQDAVEYREYLNFLGARGLINPNYEDHELEDLQGVTGLKALRAEINFGEQLSLDKLIEAIESGSQN